MDRTWRGVGDARSGQKNGRRRRLVGLVLGVMLAVPSLVLGAVVLPAGAGPPTGFSMTGTEAAYAWYTVEMGTCDPELFVGYVEARQVVYFGEQIVKPHADVEVLLDGCGQYVHLVEPAVGATNTTMVGLVSASLDEFTVDGDNAQVTDTFSLDLAWTAEGEEYEQVFNGRGEHSTQHMRDATVDGTVEFNGSELDLSLNDAVMANFNAVVIELP